jgi:hypothetical protein
MVKYSRHSMPKLTSCLSAILLIVINFWAIIPVYGNDGVVQQALADAIAELEIPAAGTPGMKDLRKTLRQFGCAHATHQGTTYLSLRDPGVTPGIASTLQGKGLPCVAHFDNPFVDALRNEKGYPYTCVEPQIVFDAYNGKKTLYVDWKGNIQYPEVGMVHQPDRNYSDIATNKGTITASNGKEMKKSGLPPCSRCQENVGTLDKVRKSCQKAGLDPNRLQNSLRGPGLFLDKQSNVHALSGGSKIVRAAGPIATTMLSATDALNGYTTAANSGLHDNSLTAGAEGVLVAAMNLAVPGLQAGTSLQENHYRSYHLKYIDDRSNPNWGNYYDKRDGKVYSMRGDRVYDSASDWWNGKQTTYTPTKKSSPLKCISCVPTAQ